MRQLAVIAAVAAVFAGCGGSGGHTYVLKASSRVDRGIYVTIISPVAIPTNLMTKLGAKIVSQPQGPQVCSFKQAVHNPTSSSAFLDGKTVTLKINGSNPIASTTCALVKMAPFDAERLGGL